MNPKLKTLFFFLIGASAGILVMYLFTNYKIERKNQYNQQAKNNNSYHTPVSQIPDSSSEEAKHSNSNSADIKSLTNENKVIDYVKANHSLPDYYITKSEAKRQGWTPSRGNLCDVLPGRAIGGDFFSNREKQLPVGAQYYEADVNYSCGNRGADRIVFNKSGEVWLSKNHYKSFDKQ